MIKASGEEVFKLLKENLRYTEDEFVVLIARRFSKDPFLLLVSIILSQNTSDKNSIRALENYVETIGTSCEDARRASLDTIEEAIRPAGLHKQKALTIKKLAEEFCEKWPSLSRSGDWRAIREWLLSIPGIGSKTADVFLQLVFNAPVFAVDTHAARIAKRWGLVGDKASYKEVSKALLDFFGPDLAGEAHRLLIVLGRRYCRARNPRCSECPLREICPYAQRQS